MTTPHDDALDAQAPSRLAELLLGLLAARRRRLEQEAALSRAASGAMAFALG